MKNSQKPHFLTISKATELISKTIKWSAPADSANAPVKGIARITSINPDEEKPIVSETIEGDDLSFAFSSDYEKRIAKHGEPDLAYGDSDRCISYEVISSEELTNHTIGKVKSHKHNYSAKYADHITVAKLSATEIRMAVSSEVETLEGVEAFIRVLLGKGTNNGGTNRSAAMGAKYEYYGLKNNTIVKTPGFAPDYRYVSQTGFDKCPCLEIEDQSSLKADNIKRRKQLKNSTHVFRRCFPKDAETHDNTHGSKNWWAEGTTKTGFTVYFD